MIDWQQLIASFFGSLGFALIFHMRGAKVWWTSLGGAVAWFVYLVMGLYFTNFMLKMAVAGFVLGIYCESMAIYTRVPRTPYIAIGIIPLIPGAGLYYTVFYCYNGDMAQSLHYAKMASGTSAAIIVGLLFAMELWSIYRKAHSGQIDWHQELSISHLLPKR